jgi:hypothetical protein
MHLASCEILNLLADAAHHQGTMLCIHNKIQIIDDCIRCIAGSVSGRVNITAVQLMMSSPGIFTFKFTAEAIESLNFTLYVDGLQAGDSVALHINTTLPSALDTTALFRAVMLQRDGQATRSNLTAVPAGTAVPVLASSWHMLYLPVIRIGGKIFRAHPGLSAQLVLTPHVTNSTSNATYLANGTTNATTTAASSNTTAVGQPLTFQGFWSSNNGSFVVPFKLPNNVTYVGQLQLCQSNTSITPFVSGLSMLLAVGFCTASQYTPVRGLLSPIPFMPANRRSCCHVLSTPCCVCTNAIVSHQACTCTPKQTNICICYCRRRGKSPSTCHSCTQQQPIRPLLASQQEEQATRWLLWPHCAQRWAGLYLQLTMPASQ